MPLGRLLTVEEVAHLALFLLSDASGLMTGGLIDLEQSVHRRPAARTGITMRRAAPVDATRRIPAELLCRGRDVPREIPAGNGFADGNRACVHFLRV